MKLEAKKYGMFTEAQNDEIVLAGGFRSGSSSSGMTRLKFDIYSKSILEHLTKNNPSESQDKMIEQSKVGFCELHIVDGTVFEIDSLVNLEITRKRKGYGSKVVQALRDSTEGSLIIRDIQHGTAAKFWLSQGVQFERDIKDVRKKASFQGGVNGEIPKDYVNAKSNRLTLIP